MSTAKTVPITIYNAHKFVLDADSAPSYSSRRTEIVALLENVKKSAEKRGQAAEEAKKTNHTMNTQSNTQATSEHIDRVLLSILAREAPVAESESVPIAA